MSERYMRNVLLSILVFAFIVVFLPAGSVQAGEGMCTNCKCDYKCQKDRILMTMNNTLDGCWWSKGLTGGCKVCDRINVCSQMGSWFSKCENAGGAIIFVKCTYYTDPVRMKAANADFGNIQSAYIWETSCGTKNTKTVNPFDPRTFINK